MTIIILIIVGAIICAVLQNGADPTMLHGLYNSAMVCPHCNVKGKVRTKAVTQKKGISGGKATGALLTGGISLLATGLSRKEQNTQARCDSCGNSWVF